MTALAKNVSRPVRNGEVAEVGVAAATRIWSGSIVQIAGGYATRATAGDDQIYFGVAITGGDNRQGSAGDEKILIRRRGAFYFSTESGAAPGVGAWAYVVDDNTVSSTSASRAPLGQVIGSDDDGVWVELGTADIHDV